MGLLVVWRLVTGEAATDDAADLAKPGGVHTVTAAVWCGSWQATRQRGANAATGVLNAALHIGRE